jgi:WD40 repeat protein
MRLFTGFGPFRKVGGSTNGVALVDLLSSTGPERVVQFKTASLTFPAASPQGDLVAVGGPNADVQLLDLDGHLLCSLDESKGALSLAFSPKADLLAVCSGRWYAVWASRPGNEIRVHDPATGRRLVSLTNHTGGVSSLAFSPDGRWLASASSDQTVRLWDTATWQEANRFQGHGSGVHTVAFSPDGKLVASGGRDVRLWKTDRADSANRVDDAFVRFGGNPAPRFLNGESMFAAHLRSGNRRHVGIWSVPSGKLLHEFPTNEWQCLGENATGTAILTLSRQSRGPNFLKFWDLHDFHLLKEVILLEATNQIRSVSLTGDRRSVLVTQPERTLEVDCETGETRKEVSLPTGTGASTRFSPDRSYWAAVGGATPDFWMGATAESSEAIRLSGHQDASYSIAFSPTEKIVATASYDRTARLWEWPNGRQLAVLAGHKESQFYCDFSPDGRTLATASEDKTVKLWNVSTHREVMTLEHDHPVTVCVFSPEGNYLATGTVNGSYHFWRAAKWDEIKDAEALNKREDEGP